MYTWLGVAYLLVTPLFLYQIIHIGVCRYVAQQMVGADASSLLSRSYHDAITDPKGNLLFFVSLGLFWLIVIGYFYFGGWKVGLLSLLGSVVVHTLLKKTLPPATSPKWLMGIHRSLVRREADFLKSNDLMRYDAIKGIREEFETKFATQMVQP